MQLPILKAMLGGEILSELIKYWPDKCCNAHGPLDRLPAPFSDDILNSITALTEAYQGRLLEFDSSKDKNRMYFLADGAANDVIERGATAYLSDISPLLSNAEDFAKALEQELNIKPGSVKLTAFISAAGSGAPTHYDAQEVISIQLVGRKRFYISPLEQIRFPYGRQYYEDGPPFIALYPQIRHGYPSCKNQTFEHIDMQPGSVLFMPRGTWHYTAAEQDSMAMSILLNPYTQVDFFLAQLRTTLLQDPAWRSPCYGLGNKNCSDVKLYKKLPNTIYKMAKSYQNPESPLQIFHKDSRYLRNPGVEARITPGEDFYQIEYPQFVEEKLTGVVKLEVTTEIAGVFHWFMMRDGPFTVGECMKNFPGISPADFKELFSRVEQSGLLKKLWFVEF
jgi:hypothetical protein